VPASQPGMPPASVYQMPPGAIPASMQVGGVGGTLEQHTAAGAVCVCVAAHCFTWGAISGAPRAWCTARLALQPHTNA
jgi:hypothetical protein